MRSTRARLVPVRDQAIRLDPAPLKSDLAAHLSMLHEVRRRKDDFDVLHFHVDLLHFPLFEDCAARTLTTLHGRLDLKDLAETYRCWPRFPMVSISDSQRKPLRFANWVGTVHHGMPESLYTFSPRARGGYLAFLGRISPEKRRTAPSRSPSAAGIPLRIAAKVDAADRAYFRDEIEPLLDDPLIEFVGEIGDAEKSRFLGDALALLFPIDWPEPFGLVMIEAMACGTPVIAWGCGSVPEVVDDGVTGRVVYSQGEAMSAVAEVAGYDVAASAIRSSVGSPRRPWRVATNRSTGVRTSRTTRCRGAWPEASPWMPNRPSPLPRSPPMCSRMATVSWWPMPTVTSATTATDCSTTTPGCCPRTACASPDCNRNC